MTKATTPSPTRDRYDLESAIVGLSDDIDRIISTARPVRRLAWSDPDRRLAAYALDDMIHLLNEVKLRLRDDTRPTQQAARN